MISTPGVFRTCARSGSVWPSSDSSKFRTEHPFDFVTPVGKSRKFLQFELAQPIAAQFASLVNLQLRITILKANWLSHLAGLIIYISCLIHQQNK